MEGGGVSGQNNPDVLMSQFGADMSAQWAQAVADEADRSREQMKKDSLKKAGIRPKCHGNGSLGTNYGRTPTPSPSCR